MSWASTVPIIGSWTNLSVNASASNQYNVTASPAPIFIVDVQNNLCNNSIITNASSVEVLNLTYDTFVDRLDKVNRPAANTAQLKIFDISKDYFATSNESCPLTEFNMTRVVNVTGEEIELTVYQDIIVFDNSTNILKIGNYAGLEPTEWIDVQLWFRAKNAYNVS